ncbi:hypothetical protein C8Q75DRAFT_523697 [Abortiporus biennis]|nr:hypothetical protein C8Q75DRAFT_523697 [Abortiporus biennis]
MLYVFISRASVFGAFMFCVLCFAKGDNKMTSRREMRVVWSGTRRSQKESGHSEPCWKWIVLPTSFHFSRSSLGTPPIYSSFPHCDSHCSRPAESSCKP